MTDWADIEAFNLVERHTIMRGDKVVALHGSLETSIAAKLRAVKMAAALDAGHRAETAVRALYGSPAP